MLFRTARKLVQQYKKDKNYIVDKKTFWMYKEERYIPDKVIYELIIKRK